MEAGWVPASGRRGGGAFKAALPAAMTQAERERYLSGRSPQAHSQSSSTYWHPLPLNKGGYVHATPSDDDPEMYADFAIDFTEGHFVSGESSFRHAILHADLPFRDPRAEATEEISAYVECLHDDAGLLNLRHEESPRSAPAQRVGGAAAGGAVRGCVWEAKLAWGVEVLRG